ncbi:MAG: FxDxF family PEP-CTERM protein [Burkholderiales bacterium]|nr:FxDxF family PEP-CTERM protein [Burkholderiales bacterium]
MSFRCIRPQVAAVGLAFLAMFAPAKATVLADPGDTIALAGALRTGSFLDVYNFSLSRALGLNDSSTYSSFSGLSTVSGFSARLYTASGSVVLISGSDGVPGPRQTANTFYLPALSAGAYRLEISGVGGGVRGGSYAGTLTAVAAIPEASTWAMMSAGLALVGMVAWRRRPARSTTT